MYVALKQHPLNSPFNADIYDNVNDKTLKKNEMKSDLEKQNLILGYVDPLYQMTRHKVIST